MSVMPRPRMLLCELSLLARLGVAGLVIVAIGGTAASGLYLYMHHEERDEREGLTIDDVKAHYHGIVSEAPLLVSLEAGHPKTLEARDRELLIEWLRGDPATMSQTYDNLDLGEDAPAEIIAMSCLDCHARSSTGEGVAPEIALEYWDDVEALAISRDLQPVPLEILAASTHTHALGMSAIGIAIALLSLMTRWPRWLVGTVVAVTGVGLTADLAGWWLTRMDESFAYMVVAGGAGYGGGMTLLGVLIMLDLIWPRFKGNQPAS